MKKNSQAFVNQLIVCLIVTIGFGGSIGVATVWMRHQISVTAESNRKLALELEKVSRRIKETTTIVETELRADALRRLNHEMRLGLVPMNEVRIDHITEDPAQRLAERASREVIAETPRVAPIKLANR